MAETWKDKLDSIMQVPVKTMDEAHRETYETKHGDIGLVHPSTGAGIMIRENKKIEGFADYGLGFRMDPTTKTLSVYASNLQIHAGNIKHVDYSNRTYFSEENEEIKGYVEKP